MAGRNIGNISNCYTLGSIVLEYNGGPQIAAPAHIHAGGLVGYSDGNLTNSYAATNVSAKNADNRGMAYAAGLVNGGIAKNCFVTGNVSTDTDSSDNASPIGVNDSSCFAYEGLKINSFVLGSHVFTCSGDELNDPTFYTDKLSWSTELWNLDNIYFSEVKYIDGKYPKLKKNCE